MLSLLLSFNIAGSDASDWTTTKKALAIVQIAIMDIAIVALCSW